MGKDFLQYGFPNLSLFTATNTHWIKGILEEPAHGSKLTLQLYADLITLDNISNNDSFMSTSWIKFNAIEQWIWWVIQSNYSILLGIQSCLAAVRYAKETASDYIPTGPGFLNGQGPYSFRMHGAMYHKMGSLLPQDEQQPSYVQMYIYDDQAALAAHNLRNSNLDPYILGELQEMLTANNPFVPLYKQAYQIMQERPPELVYKTCVIFIFFMLLCTTSCCFQRVTEGAIETLILFNQRMLLFRQIMSLRGVTLPSAFIHVLWNHQTKI